MFFTTYKINPLQKEFFYHFLKILFRIIQNKLKQCSCSRETYAAVHECRNCLNKTWMRQGSLRRIIGCLSLIVLYYIACRYSRAEGLRTKARSCRWNCCELKFYSRLSWWFGVRRITSGFHWFLPHSVVCGVLSIHLSVCQNCVLSYQSY